MTFKDERESRRPQEERIDRLAQWLEMTLGTRVTAFAVGVSQGDICRFAHGEQPSEESEHRLRNLYEAIWKVASSDGPGTANEWLVEPSPELGGRAPVDLVRAGECPRRAWFAVSPAF
jgi:hypothetical protein